MGSLKFLSVVILTLTSISAEAEIRCAVDGAPLSFEKVSNTNGSDFIIRKRADIDENTYLFYSFNPFYQIGGKVSLVMQNNLTELLVWDNGFSRDINYGKAIYKSMVIECWR